MPVPDYWYQRLKDFVDDWKQHQPLEELCGDETFAKFVMTERATSWTDFLAWNAELEGCWCFRGQREATWSLLTSLDRAVRRDCLWAPRDGIDGRGEGVEEELLFRFQQEAHLYIQHLPDRFSDRASWLALMQEHGAPTRFLDWTKSPYVAAYFAFEEEAQLDSKRCGIWAIDLDWLEECTVGLLRKTGSRQGIPSRGPEWVNYLIEIEPRQAAIVRVDPRMSNQRFAAQQGIFLCKLLHRAPFSLTLMSMMMDPGLVDRPVVRKLEVEAACRKEFLKKLRAMNIHRASLFPGLDGFARSLRLDLELKD